MDSSDGSAKAKISLPGAAYTWVTGTTTQMCKAQIVNGPNNVLGNLFMANYVTTLDYGKDEISLQANAKAPAGVAVSCPDNLCAGLNADDDGVNIFVIVGLVVTAILISSIIFTVIYCVKKNRIESEREAKMNEQIASALQHDDILSDTDDDGENSDSKRNKRPKVYLSGSYNWKV